ncbi:MAG: PsiF family protein [Zoogloeaceae bacterium]|nr:PsiF family protein [Zoogloeaceae bacterium]
MLSILVLLLSSGVVVDARATDPSPAQLVQRERMGNCNKEAKLKGVKGNERKEFMKECLSSGKKGTAEKPAMETKTAEEKEKIKTCRNEAKQKKLQGDARKAFVSQCLEG